jgi:molybdenum cofactor sulfurtransferase
VSFFKFFTKGICQKIIDIFDAVLKSKLLSMSLFSFAKKSPVLEASIVHEDYFNALYNKEFSRLAKLNQIYLDFTGGGLYAASQLRKHHDLLQHNVLGNPHSSNPTSKKSTELVEESRKAVLDYFNADDYCCVFTQNASAALKIIGECYPFDEQARFSLLMDNHNSVNGIREFAVKKNAEFTYCPVNAVDLRINKDFLTDHLNAFPNIENKLFAFPAQSNVSGVKHDLTWIEFAEVRGWDVLLDAAAFVPTSKLDLSKVKPSFVAMSFYKIFGYPTGLGCLLIRKDKFPKLQKPWFAGGTVTMVSNTASKHYLAESNERYEDGTLNYLDIPAIKIGLDFIQSIGIQKINERISGLRKFLYDSLKKLTHDNGQPLIQLYGPDDHENVGGTIIFNVIDQSGEVYFFEKVEEAANKQLISVRSGCFCNPGLDETNNHIKSEELETFYAGREKTDMHDVLAHFGQQRGAVRVSVGIATRAKDLTTFIKFLSKTYLNK